MKTYTKQQALRILNNHGIKPTAQTAVLNGVYVESGTSFYENLGDKASYTETELRNWLGY